MTEPVVLEQGFGDWWFRMEAHFHPHVSTSSPLSVEVADFKRHMWAPLATCVLYFAVVGASTHLMKHRTAWNLRWQLAAWNFALAAFSVLGTVRTAPVLISNLRTYPFRRSICKAAAADWGAGPCGLWVQLFVLSKFAELADTAFIILRKKKLLFLHWYHHFTVLLYCWHSYATEAPHALYFVSMNYAVHAVMYSYYGLMALKLRPRWLRPSCITTMQILQMVVGIAIQIAASHFSSRGLMDHTCPIDPTNILAGVLMYASYFALFLKFAVDRFVFAKFSKHTVALTAHGHGLDQSEKQLATWTFPLIGIAMSRVVNRRRDGKLKSYSQLSAKTTLPRASTPRRKVHSY